MPPWAALVVCWLAADPATREALRDTDAKLVVAGELPFDERELTEAIAIRMLEGPALPHRVEIIARGDDGIEVRLGERHRLVQVGKASGHMAARLVAISLTDLLMEIAPAPLALSATASPAKPIAVRFALLPSLGHGLSEGETYLASILAMGQVRRGRWSLGVGVGHWRTPTVREKKPGESTLAAWPARVALGVGVGRFELAASPFLAPYQVSGVRPRTGVLVGLGLSATAVFVLPHGLRLLVASGGDGFFNRTATTVGQSFLAFASPRFAPWLGAGLAVEIGP